MSSPVPRILVVEDDPAIRDAVVSALREEGLDVHARSDANDIEADAARVRPDLALLDVNLGPGPSGLRAAPLLRERIPQLPIIFLTAADDVDDRLRGFRAGADDYLTKPFAMAELLARVRALLRRSGALRADAWHVGPVLVDEAARRVTVDGTDIDLTRTEFDLFVVLGRQQGRVLSKAQLIAAVWGLDEFDPNLVEVHVSALRRKLEAHAPRVVQTVRGVGYTVRT